MIGGDADNTGGSIISVASAKALVIFRVMNSNSNSWRMTIHLVTGPCRRWQLKRYHTGLELATTQVWFVIM